MANGDPALDPLTVVPAPGPGPRADSGEMPPAVERVPSSRPVLVSLVALLLAGPAACRDGGPVAPADPADAAASVRITSGPAAIRQGDVHRYAAEVRDDAGRLLPASLLEFDVLPPDAGLVTSAGRLVAYSTGELRLVARAGRAADSLTISATPRGLSGSFEVVGRGIEEGRFTSDLWVYGGFAYTGTWSCRVVQSPGTCGNKLNVWDVRNPAAPVLTDSVIVDAQVVNDVKIRADGALAVITHEGSSDSANGITLLDLADPAHPQVIARYTNGLTAGVHNVWIEEDHVYAATDGALGLQVIDISDPTSPRTVFEHRPETSFVHDVYVRDGLAFISQWDDGLVILDVSAGFPGDGGSPAPPEVWLSGSLEVGRIETEGGQVHNTWYWPARKLALVGEEDLVTPGAVHVVDLSDLSSPVEIATFRRPDFTPHNFWMDEERGILYVAWHGNGIVAIDVSGALLGQLERQGREIASIVYTGTGGCSRTGNTDHTCAWAPQLEDGLLYASDLNSGLWVFRPLF